MKARSGYLCILLLSLILAACGGGSDEGGEVSGPAPTPTPTPPPVPTPPPAPVPTPPGEEVQAPQLADGNITVQTDETINTLLPNSGGDITSCTVSPALPRV